MARAGYTVALDFCVSLGMCDTLGNVSGRVCPSLFVLKLCRKVRPYWQPAVLCVFSVFFWKLCPCGSPEPNKLLEV